MVKGIEKFRNYFEGYEEQYVLIGGTACAMKGSVIYYVNSFAYPEDYINKSKLEKRKKERTLRNLRWKIYISMEIKQF